ncbi:hypothetical protein AD933_01145 [Acetobacter malorum]|uniref:Uncharacterized protein n=1 Tax=Acetobacter malorum TaxID=178901 RepID=A0A149S1F9_9PROT|nr:hypothetical protein AD933_01145 [Acetobacter malorum]
MDRRLFFVLRHAWALPFLNLKKIWCLHLDKNKTDRDGWKIKKILFDAEKETDQRQERYQEKTLIFR